MPFCRKRREKRILEEEHRVINKIKAIEERKKADENKTKEQM